MMRLSICPLNPVKLKAAAPSARMPPAAFGLRAGHSTHCHLRSTEMQSSGGWAVPPPTLLGQAGFKGAKFLLRTCSSHYGLTVQHRGGLRNEGNRHQPSALP